MVDFGSYIRHGPEFDEYPPMGDLEFVTDVDDDDDARYCSICAANEKIKKNQKSHYDGATTDTGWEQTQLLICPPRLLGYHLKGKNWVELVVDNVKNIQNQKDMTSFNRLEMNTSQKKLIRLLVSSHASGSENQNRIMTDFSQGKGNGLVILLHGKGILVPTLQEL